MASPQFSNIDYRLRADDSGDVQLTEDAEVLKQRFRNALMTTPGERVMRPNFGTRIREAPHLPNNSTVDNFVRSQAQKAAQIVEGVFVKDIRIEEIDRVTKRYDIIIDSPFLSKEQRVTIEKTEDGIS